MPLETPFSYSAVRFIGYALPTTPASMVDVGDPNGAGSLAGTYPAHPTTDADIAGRVDVMLNAVRTAQATLLPAKPTS